jgi:hypothetical protein
MSKHNTETETAQHGVRTAYYSNMPGGQWATLECLCGSFSTGQTDSWEDAGADLDRHIAETKESK